MENFASRKPRHSRSRVARRVCRCDCQAAASVCAKRFQSRMDALQAKLDGLKDQDQQLAHQLAAETPTAPDTAELHATANALEDAIRAGNPEHTKALLRILIAELRVNSRAEILPTYRVVAPMVCATTSSVELGGLEPPTSWVRSRRSPN